MGRPDGVSYARTVLIWGLSGELRRGREWQWTSTPFRGPKLGGAGLANFAQVSNSATKRDPQLSVGATTIRTGTFDASYRKGTPKTYQRRVLTLRSAFR